MGQPRREKKAEMLTGTWLERANVLAGLFFLLLLLLVLPPPELIVLPPDIFRFRRLLGCCRAGSAVPRKGDLGRGGPWAPRSPFQAPEEPEPTLIPILQTKERERDFIRRQRYSLGEWHQIL